MMQPRQHAVRLGARTLRRDLAAGELTLLSIALVIAVAAMSAVSLFVDRAERALAQQGSALLAADLAVESTNRIPKELEEQARRRALRTAHTLAFRSVVQAGEKLQLAEVKAVDGGYPLRGALSVAESAFGPAREAKGIPQPGTVWADARLLQTLDLEVGDTVLLGRSVLRITNVLILEPDRAGDFFSIAPRLLMNLHDVAATELIMPGSRVSHRLLVAGDPAAVTGFGDFVRSRDERGIKLLSVRDARPELRAALERADLFLGMAALTAVMVAGVAIALAARRYAERHVDAAAVMRCLGVTQRIIVAMLMTEMTTLALAAGMLGVLLGYLAQSVLAHTLHGLLGGELPAPTLRAALGGVGMGAVILFGFAMSPLIALKDVPPLRVLRRELKPLPPRGVVSYALAIGALLLIAPWHARDLWLAIYMLAGCAAAVVLLGAAAWMAVHGLNRLRNRVGVSWRYGLASVARRARTSTLQIVALGLGIMAMLLITLVHDDLVAGWQRKIPADAPNQFVINIPPGDVEALLDFLRAHGLPSAGVYPMVRGRLTRINDRAVGPEQYQEARAQRLIDREFNLSWASHLQSDNTVRAGLWWPADAEAAPQFSVEIGIAETLGIRLGDELTFQILDRSVTAPVTSLRAVQWDTFNVNFFVIAAPGLLEDSPATYITSFHLPDAQRATLNELVRRFPSVTVIDVATVMAQVRSILERANAAVSYVFLFTLLAGALVLVAAIQATQDERVRESALLKTLGASRRLIARGLLAEFMVIGLLAGLLAAAAATLTAWLLAHEVFHLDFRFNEWLWPLGTAAGIVGVVGCGLLGLQRALAETPVSVLRRLT